MKNIQIESQENSKPVNQKTGGVSNPFNPYLWKLLLVIMSLLYSSYTILINLSKENGKIPFNSGSLILLIEIFKFVLSLGLLVGVNYHKGENFWFFAGSYTRNNLKLGIVMLFSIPAFVYAVNNNLAVFIQLQMDPATYQVLGNFKTLTTALLYRIIIKRPISKIQWVALTLLMFAGICNSIGNLHEKQEGSKIRMHVTVKGLIMIGIYCTLSGIAGVYTEYVLKREKSMNLNLQNALLYFFGIWINAIILIQQILFFTSANRLNHKVFPSASTMYTINRASTAGPMLSSSATQTNLHESQNSASLSGTLSMNWTAEIFRGFSVYTWLVVITQTVCGIMMGAVMKFASNITRLYVIASAMLITTTLSVVLFSVSLNLYFLVSLGSVIFALFLYNFES